MTTTRTSVAALGAGAVLALGACGGGKSNTPKDRYIAKADAICKQVNAKYQQLAKPTNLKGLAKIAHDLAAFSRARFADFAQLTPPAAIKADVDRYIATVAKENQAIAALEAPANKGDQAAIRKITQDGIAVQQQGKKIAKDIGYKECGKIG